MHTYIHANAHIHTHAHTHSLTHAHTHTHTTQKKMQQTNKQSASATHHCSLNSIVAAIKVLVAVGTQGGGQTVSTHGGSLVRVEFEGNLAVCLAHLRVVCALFKAVYIVDKY